MIGQVAYAVGFTIPIWIGLAGAFIWMRLKSLPRLPRSPIVAGVALVALSIIGSTLAPRSTMADTNQRIASAETDRMPSVFAVVSRQDAEGVTEAQLDQEVLKKLEAWSLDRFRVNMARKLDDAGKSFDRNQITAESVFVEAGQKKLAITRFRVESTVLAAQILGIEGNKLLKVMCVTDESKDIVITWGPCDDKVREVFGVSLNPMRNI